MSELQSTRKPWSNDELRACVLVYIEMLNKEQQGLTVNKSLIREQTLKNFLSSRKSSAYDMRMANITAVLEELNLPTLLGYKAMKNVGENVKNRLILMINEIYHNQGIEYNQNNYMQLHHAVEQNVNNLDIKQPIINGQPASLEGTYIRYSHDPKVISWALKYAQGICEACDSAAPFVDQDDQPFLEVHHLLPLSQSGPDNTDNALAVCPNCHRKLHYAKDRNALIDELLEKIDRLVDYRIS